MFDLLRAHRWIGGLAALAALGGCGRSIETPLPIAVQAVVLKPEAVDNPTRYTATVREKQHIELSFKVPGTVAAMLQVQGLDGKPRDLHEGDEVTSDPQQPLARIDASDYRRGVKAAQERLAQAQAKQRATDAAAIAIRANFERMKPLRESGAIAQQAFDDVVARRDSTEAELEAAGREVAAAKVALQQAEDDLKNCALELPIEQATISRKFAEVGERVQAGRPVFEVMDLSSLRAAFSVPDTKINQFQLGQRLTVMADAYPGKQFVGRISKIQPAADLRTRSFEIEVAIDEPDGLRPGMLVSLISGQELRLILLPMTAITRGENGEEMAVFVVADEGGRKIVHKRPVQLGGVYDNRVRLVEGASPQAGEGDLVVVGGTFRLSEGQEVRLLPAADLTVGAEL